MTRKTQILIGFAAGICALVLVPSGLASPAASQTESALLTAVNQTRAAHGLGPVRLDATLRRAARAHSAEMIQADVFAHGDLSRRLTAFHVHGPFVGENLAWGTGDYAAPGTVIEEWLASPGHRANLLRPTFTRIGIGVAEGTFLGDGGATVLTADFAGS